MAKPNSPKDNVPAQGLSWGDGDLHRGTPKNDNAADGEVKGVFGGGAGADLSLGNAAPPPAAGQDALDSLFQGNQAVPAVRTEHSTLAVLNTWQQAEEEAPEGQVASPQEGLGIGVAAPPPAGGLGGPAAPQQSRAHKQSRSKLKATALGIAPPSDTGGFFGEGEPPAPPVSQAQEPPPPPAPAGAPPEPPAAAPPPLSAPDEPPPLDALGIPPVTEPTPGLEESLQPPVPPELDMTAGLRPPSAAFEAGDLALDRTVPDLGDPPLSPPDSNAGAPLDHPTDDEPLELQGVPGFMQRKGAKRKKKRRGRKSEKVAGPPAPPPPRSVKRPFMRQAILMGGLVGVLGGGLIAALQGALPLDESAQEDPAQGTTQAQPTGAPDGPAQPTAQAAPAQAAPAQAAPMPTEAPAPPATDTAAPEAKAPRAPQAQGTRVEPTPAAPAPRPVAAAVPSANRAGAAGGDAQDEDISGLSARRIVVLASARTRRGDPAGAERMLRRLLAREPRDHHAKEALAEALIALDRGAEAVPFAQDIVKRRSRRASYRIVLGDALAASGDRAGARRAWQKALKLDPDNAQAKRRLR